MTTNSFHADFTIVGAGVSGAAAAYMLTRFGLAEKPRIIVIEKEPWVAMVNSNPMNNAQTAHRGDTETNYSVEHALDVLSAHMIMRKYLESKNDPLLWQKRLRMVLGVTQKEVIGLEERFLKIHRHYPDLYMAYWEKLEEIEPNIVKGRKPGPLAALVSAEGIIVNYQRLAETLMSDALVADPSMQRRFNTAVKHVHRIEGGYMLETNKGEIRTRSVIFTAGSYSMIFAQQLGYAPEMSLLNVKGDMYSLGHVVDNKVYRPQVEGRPFAEMHADPDMLDPDDSRFGPTTRPLPIMEVFRWSTFFDYMKLKPLRLLAAMTVILWNERLLGYVAMNFLFLIPFIGKWLVLREARKIVPTLRYSDVKRRRHAGGIRPQVVDLEKKKLIMGDVTIHGDNEPCVFCTTPSPGASVSMRNGKDLAQEVVSHFKGEFAFDHEAFEREFGMKSLASM